MVAEEWIAKGFPKRTILRIVEVNPSTYYHRRVEPNGKYGITSGHPKPGYSLTSDGRKVPDAQVQEWICELVEGDGFAYGYLKLTKALRSQYQLLINKKKVYRLCKELNLLRPQRRIKTHHPRQLARNRIITGPNQLWETDIKYGYVAGEDRFFYILSVLDVYDRSVIDYHIGLSCTARDASYTLQTALWRRRLFQATDKPIIRSDNGPQFVANNFEETCLELGIEHERIPNKTPNKNAHIESFHRIMEDECLFRWEFENYGEAYEAVTDFMIRYNQRRIHSSILYMTPQEFYVACGNTTDLIKPVRV